MENEFGIEWLCMYTVVPPPPGFIGRWLINGDSSRERFPSPVACLMHFKDSLMNMRQKYMDDMNKTHIQSVKEKSQLVRKMQIIHEEGGGGTCVRP